MHQKILLGFIVFIALIGLADAWYLTESAFKGAALICDVRGLTGCNTVAQSEYSKIFGVPLALYGVFFYIGVFLISSICLFNEYRVLYKVLYIGGIIGLLSSTYFMFLQAFIIKAYCIYCIASFVLAVLLAGLTSVLWRKKVSERDLPEFS
jgi:uncharacterized membrane protein